MRVPVHYHSRPPRYYTTTREFFVETAYTHETLRNTYRHVGQRSRLLAIASVPLLVVEVPEKPREENDLA